MQQVNYYETNGNIIGWIVGFWTHVNPYLSIDYTIIPIVCLRLGLELLLSYTNSYFKPKTHYLSFELI